MIFDFEQYYTILKEIAFQSIRQMLLNSHTYTVCIKIIRIQIWRVITQNIFDKFGWFLHHC